jgi:hypothetical protein
MTFCMIVLLEAFRITSRRTGHRETGFFNCTSCYQLDTEPPACRDGETQMSSQTKLSRLTALEAIRARVFAGDYETALNLANAVSQPSCVIYYWKGICLTGLGADRALEAKEALKIALARGCAGAIGALAVAERLLGEPRAYLRELHPEEYSSFDAFDRAAILREIGISYEHDDLSTAIAYLEAAWHTAKSGPFGHVQLALIGQVLSLNLKRRGYDQKAELVSSEALSFSSRTRRVPLLYIRCLSNLELGLLPLVESDIAEIKMFIPDDQELPALVRYAEAQLARARGGENLLLALGLFDQAAELGRLAETETEFFALFGACSVQLERGIISTVLKARQVYDAEIIEVGAEVYHSQMLDLAGTQRLQAFADLREALILAWRFEARALRVAQNAVNAFGFLQHRREEGWALLTLAETHLFLNQGQANAEVLEALERASEIGLELGMAVFARELRLLPRVRAYLADLEADSRLRELLT